jgi:hypothetical protein
VSKWSKNIAVFSVWLAGLVIIAHLLIPHDHHFDSSAFSKDDSCQTENTKHPAKTPGFPFHCHSLNDLAFEKISYNLVVSQVIPIFDLFLVSFSDSVITASNSLDSQIRDFHKPLIDIDFLRLSLLRAPPAMI